MKAIFLDVDGVLNKTDSPTTMEFEDTGIYLYGIDPECLSAFEKLIREVEKEPYVIILTTTWARYWTKENKELQDNFANALDSALAEIGTSATDKIENCLTYNRAKQIKQYLKKHSNITEYVILDDENLFYTKEGIHTHWVHTSEVSGFTIPEIPHVLQILKGVLK